MGDGDVIELSIGRNDDAVWPINVYRHVAGVELSIDARARWPKTYQTDFVRPLRYDENEIILVGLVLRSYGGSTKCD